MDASQLINCVCKAICCRTQGGGSPVVELLSLSEALTVMIDDYEAVFAQGPPRGSLHKAHHKGTVSPSVSPSQARHNLQSEAPQGPDWRIGGSGEIGIRQTVGTGGMELQVEVVRAVGLVSEKLPNPFCELRLTGDLTPAKSTVLQSTRNPTWSERFTWVGLVDTNRLTLHLQVRVY